jgi:ribosome modulation factor
MTAQKALILGNGASMCNYTTPRDRSQWWIIGTNRWFERTSVDAVVCADRYQVQYCTEVLIHTLPVFTREPWATHYHAQCVPGAQTQEIAGSLAIRVAAQTNCAEIHCVGFDAYTQHTSAKFVEPPLKRSRPTPPDFWHTAIQQAVFNTHQPVLFHSDLLGFLHTLNMHNGDSNL